MPASPTIAKPQSAIARPSSVRQPPFVTPYIVMAEEAGAFYFIVQFSFGDLTHDEVKRSATIFAREVIPSIQDRLARVS